MPPDAKDAPSAQATPESSGPDDEVSDYIDLNRGKELNEEGAINFASSKPVRLVVIAGQVKGGKTTLLTSLYEMFQAGPVSGQNFAGSITLPGLEDRCHLARMESDNATSETRRTPYKGPDPFYLHLRTATVDLPLDATDFLFTDVSGEMFEHAIDSTNECRELRFLKRANHFVLLLDGEKGVRQEKWTMIQNARTLLQSCLDCDMLASHCLVSIIWSKFDYFEAAAPGERTAHAEFRDEVVRDFKQRFAHRIPNLKFGKIAARPKRSPMLGFGNGVTELFSEWLAGSPLSRQMNLCPEQPYGARESELFALRYKSAENQ